MGETRSRRDSLSSLLITELLRETQYGNSMFFVRIFIKVTSKNLVLEKGVSGNTFPLNANDVLRSRGLFWGG
jgi:hypothetical protein